MKRKPQDRELYLGVALGFLNLRRPRDALAELRLMEEEIGWCEDGFTLTIAACNALGDVQGLLVYARKAMALHRWRHARAWSCLIFCHGCLGQLEIALNCTTQALSAFPDDPVVLYETARLLAKFGQKKNALDYVKRCLEADIGMGRYFSVDPDFDELRGWLLRGKR